MNANVNVKAALANESGKRGPSGMGDTIRICMSFDKKFKRTGAGCDISFQKSCRGCWW